MSKRPLLEGTSLFQRHLQPSKPPASATKAQLDLYKKILSRRTHQLNNLPLSFLESIYKHLFDTSKSSELQELLKQIPEKAPKNALEHVSLVRYLLTGHFHKSIDSKLPPEERTTSLNSLKEIFFLLDDTFTKFTKEASSSSSVTDTTSVAANDPSLRKKPAARSAPVSSAATSQRMGLGPSKPAPPPHATAGGTGGGANDVIEIIDDSPPPSPGPSPLPQSEPAGNEAFLPPSSNSTKIASKEPALPAKKKVPTPSNPKPKPPGRTIPQVHRKPPRAALGPRDPLRSAMSVSCDFRPDNGVPTWSASLPQYQRQACKTTFLVGFDRNATRENAFGTYLEGPDLDKFEQRLEKWDPYWKTLVDCSVTQETLRGETYEFGTKTALVQSTLPYPSTPLKTACQLQIDFRKIENAKINGFNYGAPSMNTFSNGDKRLLVRMLPLTIPEKYKKKKADTHQWPKGTFLQVNKTPFTIVQRKQQSHDHVLWKGMSHPLDLTPHISHPRGQQRLELVTKDQDSYAIQMAVCEYRSPENLFELCLSPPHTPGSIEKWSYDEGLKVTRKHANQGAVVLDSDDEDDGDGFNERDVTLTFSLLCPMSYQAIETPVRGRQCKHIQCFDLLNYLKSNVTVSGGRWRCAVCEEFVSLQDLILDGMVVKMLEKHRHEVSGSRDKISFCRDGSWFMRDENKLRYQKKRPGSDATGGPMKRGKIENVEEIIDID